ncbi:MAG: hypothetical protein EXS64_08730 [Candidatus Latescibacteria bacterium]|nr:hypothetical protein [Candidatus Latescibacterota bacterium]
MIRKILMIALLIAGAAEGAFGQGATVPFQIPFRTFFYDAKLDTGQAEVPSTFTQTFVDSAGTRHRITWRPGFDVRVSSRSKRFGLPPFRARTWLVSSMAVTIGVDLDGVNLTTYRFEIKRSDKFEIGVQDTTFVTRGIPGGDFRSPLLEIVRPRLEFLANEEVLRPTFLAEVKVKGRFE